jgi:hydroxymethylpyrimidine pyrophosphatase-like HAD family hydrolase
MGNASPAVKARARFETKSNDDNGFAYAVEHLIVPRT